MKYILDFDRVLFNTDAFSARLKETGLHMPRGSALLEAIEEQGIDWEEFVYPAAREFLAQHGSDCVIVSSFISTYRGDNSVDTDSLEFFQREKIKRSGLHDLVGGQVYVVGESKEEALSELRHSFAEPLVFIDDSPRQVKYARELEYEKVVWLSTAKELFSNPIEAPSFVAEHIEGVERVTSFAAFMELVKKWKQEQNDQ